MPVNEKTSGPVRRLGWATTPFRWSSPPGRLFHGILTLAAVGSMWSASAPAGAGLGAALGALAVFGVAAMLWAIRGLAFLARTRREGHPPAGGWRFVIAPLGGFLLVGLLMARVPFQARWALSESDFDRAVGELQAEGPPRVVALDERIGLYRVSERLTQGAMVIYVVDGGGLWEEGGVAWLPDGYDSFVGADTIAGRYFEGLSVDALGDGWYSWETRVD